MKFLIVLCAALACAAAKPQVLAPWAIPNGYAYSAAAPWASPLGHPIAQPLAYSAWPAANLAYSGAPLAYSAPAYSAAPLAYSAHAVAAPVAVAAAPLAHKSQYHAQDELGQASYGHSEPSQTHNAVQDAFGNKVGSFSYTAPDGRILRTDYVADALGYRVSSNALPVAAAGLPLPVQDTPEVAIAKAQHLAAHGVHRIAKRSIALLQTPASTAPLAYAAAPAIAHTYAAPAIAHTYAAAPVAYSAAHTTIAHSYAAPIAHAYAAPAIAAPLAYSAAPAVTAVHAGPVLRDAIQTTVVNTPGHAVSYRVD
ncbi:Cuticle Protein CPR RR Unclassified 26 [Frankliniella occidentalis]|uniref:Cuticle protein 19.8-like n=1 Tax=Frankliniella occidentalis TaxID=133901 RepID=A0A6J1S5U2_FRAOC|nr:cuticle protein 19.8-like [Frankliniella occidentalis]KAE8738399.1 Cuticle Protein CPR RR Unclassified 26 [Frankliniella occidentalis]